MENQDLVTILEWPAKPAALEHRFVKDQACPVLITFDQSLATVQVQAPPERAFNVDMNMSLLAQKAIPLCITVCEDICINSDYEIDITFFGAPNPFASIRVKGKTIVAKCNEVS